MRDRPAVAILLLESPSASMQTIKDFSISPGHCRFVDRVSIPDIGM